jgi:hypothetical protein
MYQLDACIPQRVTYKKTIIITNQDPASSFGGYDDNDFNEQF